MKLYEEDQDMEVLEYNNNIERLLKLKGNKRLEVENSLTRKILEFDYEEKTPGVRLRFLETRKKDKEYGEWYNYNILFEAVKYKDNPEYLSHVFSSISKIVKSWEGQTNIDVVGIQEVDCEEAEYYYILIYILSDGKEKELPECKGSCIFEE